MEPGRGESANNSRHGQVLLKLTATHRTLTRTKAPIFNSRVRIVPQVACASSVPFNPASRNWFINKLGSSLF